VQPPQCLLKGVIEELEEFWKTLGDVVASLNGGFNSPSQWSVPAVGNIKINWDVALDGRKKLMGVGIMARDSLGRVVAAMCAFLPYMRDPTTAEAIGARRAVEFGHELGFNSIELEGDVREVVLALESAEVCEAAYESIIMETHLLLESYQFWMVNHIRR
jgi:pantoate kinase